MANQEEITKKEEPLVEIKRKIIVDLWRTRLHGEIVGIKQKEEYMAKSRQFNRDLELFGEVKEEKNGEEETIGYVGYRQGLWDEEQDKLNRRLVIKLFSKSMYYQGTIEELIGREFTRSISARKDFPCFTVLLDNHDYLISVNKTRGGIFVPEWFVFRLTTEKGLIPIILKHKIGPGIDYRVVNAIGQKQFGMIDGKKFDIGGKFVITLKAKEDLLDNNIIRTLILFAASLKFHKDIYDKIKTGVKKMRKGEWEGPILSNEELLLLRNPRAILRK